jgi:pyruvate/2-oxoglutarate dehydrogenase complex dihydrolipoamide dehydrogenase (E3) component
VHVIGERASELVHIGQTAIHLGGTVDMFIDMVFTTRPFPIPTSTPLTTAWPR